jgi:ATP-dependent helicase HrpA
MTDEREATGPVLMRRDAERLRRLRRRMNDVVRRGKPADRISRQISELLDEGPGRVVARQRALPVITYPDSLPVATYRDQIIEAIGAHQVVIVAGETGSGKTTQLPKMCLEAGLGVRGEIGCTQPRRIAAVTVAARVSEELGVQGTATVGHQVRFDNATDPTTLIKFMTDGILLAQIPSDRLLLGYDALIIDEAHERSLNIDFLLGYLKQMLPRRPDLRVLVSSATLDVARFSQHFDNAPVIDVPGRTFPVEVRYQDPRQEEMDLPHEVARAVEGLTRSEPRGDILVFLSGEQDIRETEKVLSRRIRQSDTEVIPLLARLPVAQQRRAFQVGGRQRIVLATNVAETSVTIPGIRYVIDSGLARLNRYNPRTQVQRLHIEAISQASARQRQGRCGRLGPGICIRLGNEEEFAQRDDFTPPEIRRVSLASVILRMMDLGLGRVEQFPFLDPPAAIMVSDGYRELEELGALTRGGALTPLGRQLVRLPTEPRLGRMLLAAGKGGALEEVLTLVAALSVDDVRLRPIDKRDEADALHRRFQTETNDFAGLVKLWAYWKEACRAHRSRTGQRRFCHSQLLSYRRLREWENVRRQLAEVCREIGLKGATHAANDEQLLHALLPGLLNKVGMRTPEGDYRGARGVRFWLHPGSGVAKKRPPWVVAGELVDTSRLFGRTVAAIDVGWLEPLAGDLCSHSYGEPFWEPEEGYVRVKETVRLYGLPIIEGRQCDFSRVDLDAARSMFIAHALVRGEAPHLPAGVLRENTELFTELRQLEARTRCHDLLIDESDIVALYAARLGARVCSLPSLKRWFSGSTTAERESLRFSRDELLRSEPDALVDEHFPTVVTLGNVVLPLSYRHRRGEDIDGVTCVVPISDLDSVSAWSHDWGVPGLLPEKVLYLLRCLPKRIRKGLVPVPGAVKRFLSQEHDRSRSLREALTRFVRYETGEVIPSDMWPERVPDHLAVRFEVIDDSGKSLASGRDWEQVVREASEAVGGRLQAQRGRPTHGGDARPQTTQWQRTGLVRWDVGTLPERVDVGQSGMPVYHYPTLVDRGATVDLALLDHAELALRAHADGVHRLCMLGLEQPLRKLGGIPSLGQGALAGCAVLRMEPRPLTAALAEAAVRSLCQHQSGGIRTAEAFEAAVAQAAPKLYHEVRQLQAALGEAIPKAMEVLARCEGLNGEAFAVSVRDVRDQISALFRVESMARTPARWLMRYPAYLRAAEIRLEKLRQSVARDGEWMAILTPYLAQLPPLDPSLPETLHANHVVAYRWHLEEWRISLFAQQVGTATKVSAKRLDRLWSEAAR